MSDYTKVTFRPAKEYSKKSISNYVETLWDAFELKRKVSEENGIPYDYYELTISELNLYESLSILNKLKDKYKIMFYIEYGVY